MEPIIIMNNRRQERITMAEERPRRTDIHGKEATIKHGREKQDHVPPMCGQAMFTKLLSKSRGSAISSHSTKKGPHSHQSASGSTVVRSSREISTEIDESNTVGAIIDDFRESPGKRSWGLPTPKTSNSGTSQNHASGARYYQPLPVRKMDRMPSVLPTFDPIDADYLEVGPLRQQARRHPSSDVPSQSVPQSDPKLRNKHIRSNTLKKRSSRNSIISKPSKMSTSLPSLTEVPSDAGEVMEALEGTHSHSHGHSPTPSEESPSPDDSVKLLALNSMRDVVHKQQETLQAMASQNHQYRLKLGVAETTYHSLQKDQTGQKSAIDQLRMEKDSFEAEALFLREEMQTIRQELEMLRSAIHAPTVTAPSHAPVSAPVVYPRDYQGFNHAADGARRSGARDPDEDRDVAANDWNLELETSMKKHEYDELSCNPSVKQNNYFGSHEDYLHPSETSMTARTSGTASRSSASPHPPDPPEEIFKSSTNKKKDKKEKQEMHMEDIEQVRRLLMIYGQHEKKEGASVISQRSKSSELGSERSFPSRGSKPEKARFQFTEDSIQGSIPEEEQPEEPVVLIENMETVDKQIEQHGRKSAEQKSKTPLAKKGSAHSQERPAVPEYQAIFDKEQREMEYTERRYVKGPTSHPTSTHSSKPEGKQQAMFKRQIENLPETSVTSKAASSSAARDSIDWDRFNRLAAMNEEASDDAREKPQSNRRSAVLRQEGHTRKAQSEANYGINVQFVMDNEDREQPEFDDSFKPRTRHGLPSQPSSFTHDMAQSRGARNIADARQDKAYSNQANGSYHHGAKTGIQSDAYKKRIESLQRKREHRVAAQRFGGPSSHAKNTMDRSTYATTNRGGEFSM
jgi:hypothetical protein